MKLFWKLLTGMLAIILLSFTIFGTVLLQSFLQSSLDKETERGMEEVRMLQYAFLASVEGLEESYTVDERTIKQLTQSVADNVGDGVNEVVVYDEDGRCIYPSQSSDKELYHLLKNASSGDNCVWRLTLDNGIHKMEAMTRMDCIGQTYYLEIRRNIQDVYDNWENGYRAYRVTLVVLACLAAVLSVLFAAGFTAPIRKLSLATKAFSNGVYERRVKVKGRDEIADLMQDFNGMADRLENNIYELRENARRQEEFTGAFAHELKTPLTSIIGYAEMLMTMELNDEDRRQSAGYIYREGRRLESLSYKMMELIRIGKLGASMGKVDMAELGERLVQLMRVKLADKKIEMQVNMEDGAIVGDMDLLLSLLSNLVDNSRKACNEGGHIVVTGSRRLQVKDSKLPSGMDFSYGICVKDNGRGIPKEELERVTEAFYMVDKSRARKEGGAGLGMAICRQIIEVHGAEWNVESTQGEGTCITMLFPKNCLADASYKKGELK